MSEQDTNTPPQSELVSTIGINIRRERLARKISIGELAEYIGCNYATITKYENGKINISMNKLAKIAEYLDVPVETLLKKEN